jgi:superfamily II DNA/RNA helicase
MNYPILLIAEKLQVENISKDQSFQEQFEGLANYLDNLVATDFNRLISILYRIDVSEDKARKAIADEAGNIAGPYLSKVTYRKRI